MTGGGSPAISDCHCTRFAWAASMVSMSTFCMSIARSAPPMAENWMPDGATRREGAGSGGPGPGGGRSRPSPKVCAGSNQ